MDIDHFGVIFFLNEKMFSFLQVLLSNSVFSFMCCFCERDRDIFVSRVQVKRCRNETDYLYFQYAQTGT